MKFAVLDFETTGAQPYDRIIQVGLVVIDEQNVLDTYASYVDPGMPITEFITGLTGITNEMLIGAPAAEKVMEDLQRLLQDAVLVAHNAQFDLGFLQKTLSRCGFDLFSGRVLDTIDLLRILFPGLPSLQLNRACRSLNVEHARHHQADSDAEATAGILLKCLQRLDQLPLLTIQRLAAVFDGPESDQDVQDLRWFLHEILRRKEMTTVLDPDSTKYFRQFVLNVGDWSSEEPVSRDGLEELWINRSFEDFYAEFKPSLQQQFARFEDRDAQDRMIGEVYASLENQRHLIVEAGTGTGKSLGYLIPSLYFGTLTGSKIVVSTHTINLQEQIRSRDIPLLQTIFPLPFRAALLKGRNHYLCLRKFEQKINGSLYENGNSDLITAAQMIVWLSETERGDEEELHLGNHGSEFWRSVESDADSCLNRACPWFKKCFYHRARHEANIADVIITNHSLVLTDVKAENRLLPAYSHLIVDEAHHFEEVAGKHLGMEAGYFSMANLLTWLFKDSRSGQLPGLRLTLSQYDDAEHLQSAIDEFFPLVVRIKERWDLLAEGLFQLLTSYQDAAGSDGGQLVLRIKPDKPPKGWDELLVMEDNLYVELSEFIRKLESLTVALKDNQDEWEIQSVLTDLGGTVQDLYRLRDTIRFVMKMSDGNHVFWLEASQYYKSKSIQLFAVPIDISPMLKQFFFEAKESVVLTSATLSVDKSFQYACEQLGLDEALAEGKLKTSLLPSPFNYREQVLMCIPRDFPDIRGGSDRNFIEELANSLMNVAIETRGRMMVLFTSYRMLRSTYELLKELLDPHDIQVLGQSMDSGSRSQLISLFQENPRCILLGTSSFWEGVDIPGQALSCLAIVRLPFQPPNHPLVEAKSEVLKQRNQNPFIKYSVPQAVIKFKQGFGRLVRTAMDTGIVIVYDTRLLTTSYGKYFLYSLPGPKIEHLPTNQLAQRVREWMDSKVEWEEGEKA
ncbi:ATP-dependent DNA helicase DinG [Ferviditalea candida]|uniref:3'-5' exonuclease DinG n=1 Tax=Ferviditalea candida TaxID=3108399 RepID=A0ABU5ZGE0_9BACL|nr:ATP-dependent DNA helicase DinG [Paenibacillaceae bacterium T2]